MTRTRKTPDPTNAASARHSVGRLVRRYGVGSLVRAVGWGDVRGIVTKTGATHVYVEWVGFPPNVPLDGWVLHREVRPVNPPNGKTQP